jgi:hypothetical protein
MCPVMTLLCYTFLLMDPSLDVWDVSPVEDHLFVVPFSISSVVINLIQSPWHFFVELLDFRPSSYCDENAALLILYVCNIVYISATVK